MPLNTLNLDAVLQWQFTRTNPGFGSTNEGLDSLDFNTANLLDTYDQATVQQLTINPDSSVTIDLTNLTNLVYENFSLGHVLLVLALPVGSSVHIAPGATNPLQWFFDDTTHGVTIPPNGLFLYSEDPGNTGVPVTSTAKTLTFSNPGSTTLTLNLAIAGSTT